MTVVCQSTVSLVYFSAKHAAGDTEIFFLFFS